MRFTIAIIILAVLFASLGSGQEPASKASDDAVVYVYATKHIKGILGGSPRGLIPAMNGSILIRNGTIVTMVLESSS